MTIPLCCAILIQWHVAVLEEKEKLCDRVIYVIELEAIANKAMVDNMFQVSSCLLPVSAVWMHRRETIFMLTIISLAMVTHANVTIIIITIQQVGTGAWWWCWYWCWYRLDFVERHL